MQTSREHGVHCICGTHTPGPEREGTRSQRSWGQCLAQTQPWVRPSDLGVPRAHSPVATQEEGSLPRTQPVPSTQEPTVA